MLKLRLIIMAVIDSQKFKTMETQQYLIKPRFAHREGIPSSFVAAELRETNRAIYVYGHGAKDMVNNQRKLT